jgi:hypothetical protein
MTEQSPLRLESVHTFAAQLVHARSRLRRVLPFCEFALGPAIYIIF